MPKALFIHTAFDILAVAVSIIAGGLVYRWRLQDAVRRTASKVGKGYFLALSLGSIIGSFGLGTVNLYISGQSVIGRSVLGALAGATLTVELYKWQRGIKGSTGFLYVVPFCTLIIVGRLGCFFSGLNDHTYGIATTLPWGHDFGDGIARHPVQLYESTAMLFFLLGFLILLQRRPQLGTRHGFYGCVSFYALQRFFLEFLKPYSAVFASLNLFHVTCLMLVGYSVVMMIKTSHAHRTA